MDKIEQGILDGVAVIDEALMEMRRILSQDSDIPVASPVVAIDEAAEWLIEDEKWREEVKDLVFGLLAEKIAGEEALLYPDEKTREIVDQHDDIIEVCNLSRIPSVNCESRLCAGIARFSYRNQSFRSARSRTIPEALGLLSVYFSVYLWYTT